MAWPSITEFSEAVQNPDKCFQDPELAQGAVALNQRGLPLVFSGNFACVYQVSCNGTDSAVRCFTRAVNDQEQRYTHLDEYLSQVWPENLVSFRYLSHGIKVKGEWYPVVKMQWVKGVRLDKFIENNLNNPRVLEETAARWRGVNGSLRGLGIAHNDLQHGNAMVQDDRAIRLVDYDGVFLPRFSGQVSPELGHKHYQHPQRAVEDYNEGIDNFPSLVVYLSLLALRSDAGLWERFYNQDNLIFTKDDYCDPSNSECFIALKSNGDRRVAELAARLEEYCRLPVEEVPELEIVLESRAAPSTTAPPQTGNATTYRNLIQSGETVHYGPATISTPAQTEQYTQCPKCGRTNHHSLIYCPTETCAAVLHAGRRNCTGCHASIPENSIFCPDCGVRLAAPTAG